MSFFLFVIFTVYAMLPLDMRDAITAGVTTSLLHLLVLGLYLGPQPDSRPALLPQVSTQEAQASSGLARLGAACFLWGFTSCFVELTPWQGSGFKHRPSGAGPQCQLMPANARGGLWPPGKGVRQGTRMMGTDVDNRTFTENVKIRA